MADLKNKKFLIKSNPKSKTMLKTHENFQFLAAFHAKKNSVGAKTRDKMNITNIVWIWFNLSDYFSLFLEISDPFEEVAKFSVIKLTIVS